MNENTEKLLEVAVAKGLEIAEQTGQFIMAQAPELLQEFYMWHIAMDIVWIVISIPTMIASAFFLIKWYKDTDTWSDYETIGVISIFTGIISVLVFILFTLDLIKLTVAPKLYLIEYFTHSC